MKKFISLLLMALLLVSMSVTSFASDYASTVAITNNYIEVGDANGEVVVNFSFKPTGEAFTSAAIAIELGLPDGIEFVSANMAEYEAICDKITDESDGLLLTYYDDDMDTTISEEIVIPLTFKVTDTSAAASYKVELLEGTTIGDVDGEPSNDIENLPYATIYVANKIDATVEEVAGSDAYGYGLSFVAADEHKDINKIVWNIGDQYSAAKDLDLSLVEGNVKVAFESAVQYAVDSINALMKSASAMYFTE